MFSDWGMRLLITQVHTWLDVVLRYSLRLSI